jgi:hypothetical protein
MRHSIAYSLLALTFSPSLLPASDKEPIRDSRVASWVQKQMKRLQPGREDKLFDQVGWVPGILPAEKLAQQYHRPIFLFTYDGQLGTGRC